MAICRWRERGTKWLSLFGYFSVDLQTKTATFQTGMADAARAARGSFTEIKSGASEMGESTNYSMGEARHSVMMLGEEFGVHLPRGLTSFIAGLGPVGPALEAAFPFLAIALGATLLIEHFVKLKEAGQKLTEDQENFKQSVEKAFNSLEDKGLQAQKRIDELRGNHVKALKDELELIDHQSMNELLASFEAIGKESDKIFADLKSHWYTFGSGSDGATKSLKDFEAQYNSLLLSRDKAGADALIQAKVERERNILALQNNAADTGKQAGTGSDAAWAAAVAAERAKNQLKEMGAKWDKDAITSEGQLVAALNEQLKAESQIQENTKKEKTAATLSTGNKGAEDARKRALEMVEARKSGMEYEVRVMAEANKQIEDEVNSGWRADIAGTQKGSAERLQVIDEALANEKELGMEKGAYYRSLSAERMAAETEANQATADRAKEAALEESSNTQKMNELALADVRRQYTEENSIHAASKDTLLAQAEDVANREYQIQHDGLEAQISALDQYGADYANKLKSLQDKERQATQQHEDELTSLKKQAQDQRNVTIKRAEDAAVENTISGLTRSIMGQQSWAKTAISLADEVASSMIQAELKHIAVNLMSKESDGAAAARAAFVSGMKLPFPTNVVAAPIMAAAAFAQVMAFEGGTDRVPGAGRGDSTPAMLTPGEGVVPGGVMDGLRNVARTGGFDRGGGVTVHVRPTYHVNTIDGDGMRAALEKNTTQLQRHFEGVLRKMNR